MLFSTDAMKASKSSRPKIDARCLIPIQRQRPRESQNTERTKFSFSLIPNILGPYGQ